MGSTVMRRLMGLPQQWLAALFNLRATEFLRCDVLASEHGHHFTTKFRMLATADAAATRSLHEFICC